MKHLSRLWIPVLLVGPLGALRPSDDADWTDQLFYPLLEAPPVEFYVNLDDLRGVSVDDPEDRVRDLQERIDDGEDDLDVQLQYVRALLDNDEKEEALEKLEDLGRDALEILTEDPEDWEVVAELGEISRLTGTRFKDRKALESALTLLNAVRANDDDVWNARLSLAQLFLWQSGRLRQAGQEENADEALDHAHRMAEEAIEIAEDEFLPHAILFLIELTKASFEYRGDAEAGLERMIEIADSLEEASDNAEDPEVTVAIADIYVLLYMLRNCQVYWDTVEAFDELALGDGEGSARARDADMMVERMGALDGHYRLWGSASLVRWWLARHAGLEDEGEIFEEAIDAAREPALVLESAIGLESRAGEWEAAEAFGEMLLEEREDERSLFLTARLAGMRGDLEASIEGFEEALEIDPDMLESSIGLAISLLKAGEEIERATELLEDVLEEDDELFTAHFAMASALVMEDDPDRALEHLESALDLADDARIIDYRFAAEAAIEELEED